MKNLILNIGGERVQVWMQTLGNEVWMHFNGKTFIKELSQKSKRRGRSQGEAAKNHITAPMPGKILAVKVNAGDSIKKGDLIVVMEAMKMEYSLKAPADGSVKKINCKENDQVNLKQVLVELNFLDKEDG